MPTGILKRPRTPASPPGRRSSRVRIGEPSIRLVSPYSKHELEACFYTEDDFEEFEADSYRRQRNGRGRSRRSAPSSKRAKGCDSPPQASCSKENAAPSPDRTSTLPAAQQEAPAPAVAVCSLRTRRENRVLREVAGLGIEELKQKIRAVSSLRRERLAQDVAQ